MPTRPLALFFLFIFLSFGSLYGNSDTRDWTMTFGKTFRAELVSYNAETGQVLLKFDDVENRTYPFEDFSVIDQAWLVEWLEFEEQLHLQLEEMGGDFKQESAMLARFKDIFPEILERVRLAPDRVFMGGTSGGAWKAFHYSAWVKYPWAGIYSNVGWLGGKKYYNLPYPGGMRVAIVNGNQDRAANGVVDSDSRLLQEAGNKVAVMMFEGGHQVPPVDAQIKAFNWLLENEDFEEL